MNKLGVVIVISLFLIGFAMAGMTTKAISENGNGNQVHASTENEGEETELEIQNRIKERHGNLTDEQIEKIFTIKNKIKNPSTNETCPDKCKCAGSTTKCFLGNGTREMTILAGDSGNIIIQAKGINASTNVTLYKSDDGKIYAISKDNETRIIKMLPDQVRERIRERLEIQLRNENMTLDENGTYQYRAEKKARLFFLFQINVPIQAEIDPETGEVLRIKNPWWSFLTKDDVEEQLVGASCGTVTPGYNDACCQDKEYDFWNSTAAECQFNSED